MTTEELYEAIKEDDLESVEEYLQSVEYINYAILKKIDAALSYAVRFDKIDSVKLLISYNANPDQYQSLLDLALMHDCSSELIEYLRTGI